MHNSQQSKSTHPNLDSHSTRPTAGRSGPAGSGTGGIVASGLKATTTTPLPPPEMSGSSSTNDKKSKEQEKGKSLKRENDDEDEEEQQGQLLETSTHIVVEHHRTGTVKTHVFSSKDGQPSMFGHAIPDTNDV
jgi:hypothetical protein